MILLKQSVSTDTKNYEIKNSQFVNSNGLISKNTIEINVSKRFIQKDKYGSLYEIIENGRKQSDTEGMRGMNHFISQLYQKLLVYTNMHGEITSVVNLGEIEELWSLLKKDFSKKFVKEKETSTWLYKMDSFLKDNAVFTNFYKQTAVATLLFSPIYNNVGDKHIIQSKNFMNFFDSYRLPLVLKTSIVSEESNDNNTVLRCGGINHLVFNDENVKALYRKKYKNSFIESITAKYIEINKLTKDYLSEALFTLDVNIQDLYIFNQKATILIQN